jgi:predicted transport protein
MENTMADTKLFNIKGAVKEYQSGTVTLEKELQTVIENNMNIFFGVTFLASEYRTTDGGRMDSIGIDENHCPVIFEYKRSVKENVINQGLFYLNWLLDHKDSFKVLVIEKLGLKAANNIDWSMPRVVCVAGDFTKYDESAIKQMNRNISLIRYKKFGEDLLMFEQVNENVVSAIPDNEPVSKTKATDKTFDEQIRNADENIRVLYENLSNYILSLGDDISESHLKLYAAFKKIRNVVTVVAQKKKLILNLPLDVSTVSFKEGFSRDVTNIGHWGCGAVELYLQSGADFEKAKPLIDRAFDEN